MFAISNYKVGKKAIKKEKLAYANSITLLFTTNQIAISTYILTSPNG